MSHHLLHRTVAGDPVTREHAATLLRAFAEGHALPEQLAAALTALRIRGESSEVLIGFTEVLREQYIPVELEGLPAVDIVGTGGDGQHTVNLSTAAAIVVAGAGVPVAKHGNHGVSSKTGSADVLQALGLPLKLSPEAVARCIREVGLGFIYAPGHHPLFAKIGPVRRALGFPTAFNLLGPVCNPAQVKRQVIGAFSPQAMRLLAEVLAALGTERTFVLHTPGPYDEVSLTAPTTVLEVSEGKITEHTFKPEDFGSRTLEPEELTGGEAAANAERIIALLKGQKDGVRQAVCANAACALLVAGKASTLAEGFRMAEASIDSGAAYAKLEALRALTREL
nr:anthranilate phosphoribosyltransferase [uncultured Holophaga sp.]